MPYLGVIILRILLSSELPGPYKTFLSFFLKKGRLFEVKVGVWDLGFMVEGLEFRV